MAYPQGWPLPDLKAPRGSIAHPVLHSVMPGHMGPNDYTVEKHSLDDPDGGVGAYYWTTGFRYGGISQQAIQHFRSSFRQLGYKVRVKEQDRGIDAISTDGRYLVNITLLQFQGRPDWWEMTIMEELHPQPLSSRSPTDPVYVDP